MKHDCWLYCNCYCRSSIAWKCRLVFLSSAVIKSVVELIESADQFWKGKSWQFYPNYSTWQSNAKGAFFRVSFLGGLTLHSLKLHIAAPSLSKNPHSIEADNVKLKWCYVDVWRANKGHPICINSLQVIMLDSYIEPMSDGRASCQFNRELHVSSVTPRRNT